MKVKKLGGASLSMHYLKSLEGRHLLLNGIYNLELFRTFCFKGISYLYLRGQTSVLLNRSKIKSIYIQYFFPIFFKKKANVVIFSSSVEREFSIIKPWKSIVIKDFYNEYFSPLAVKYDLSSGIIKCIYINRIDENKNLSKALLEWDIVLNGQKLVVELDVYGPFKDKFVKDKFFGTCKKIVNIRVCYLGIIFHEDRLNILKNYDFGFLPSKFESLSIFALDCFYHNLKLICYNRDIPFFDLYEKCGNAVLFWELDKYKGCSDSILRNKVNIYFHRLNKFNEILLKK